VQYSRPERLAIPLSLASSSVNPASSEGVISSPTGLPRASLIAASRFSSGKVTVSGSVYVVVDVSVSVSSSVTAGAQDVTNRVIRLDLSLLAK